MTAYPNGGTFRELLWWHLRINVTCPPGQNKGEWTNVALAEAIGISSAAVGQLLSGKTKSPTKNWNIDLVLAALFGRSAENDDAAYATWRAHLRSAFKEALEGDPSEQRGKTRPSPISVKSDKLASAATRHDAVIPLDLIGEYDTRGPRRFSPLNDRLRFYGRGDEIARVRQFAEGPEGFAWWLTTGSGGAGKTRLAREICFRLQDDGWRAGLLPNTWSEIGRNIDGWQPDRPTFIVIDYAHSRAEGARHLAVRLSMHKRSLPHPVRLLMLDRRNEMESPQGFLARDSAVLRGTAYQTNGDLEPPLELGPVDDDQIWELVRGTEWRERPVPLAIERTEFINRLAAVDPKKRVLAAMILADALAANPAHARLGSLEDELRSLLARDRLLFWPESLRENANRQHRDEADAAIALATTIGGLRPPDVAALERLKGPRLTSILLNDCARAVGVPLHIADQDAELRPLEPDLIGEFFVLQLLTPPPAGSFPVEAKAPWLASAAWNLRSQYVLHFLNRASQNFPHHPALEQFDQPVHGVALSWLRCAGQIYNQADSVEEGVQRVMAFMSDRYGADAAAREAFGMIIESVFAKSEMQEAPDVLYDYFVSLCKDQKRYGKSGRLHILIASCATYFILDHAKTNSDLCVAVFQAIQDLRPEFTNDNDFMEEWSFAAAALVGAVGEENGPYAFQLAKEIYHLTETSSSSRYMHIRLGHAIAQLAEVAIGPLDQRLCQLVEDAIILAKAHPYGAELRSGLSDALIKLTSRIADQKVPIDSASLVLELVEKLSAWSEVEENVAGSIMNVMINCSAWPVSEDADPIRQKWLNIYDTIRQIASARIDTNLHLTLDCAKTSFNIVSKSTDIDTALAHVSHIFHFVELHKGNTNLHEILWLALANFLVVEGSEKIPRVAPYVERAKALLTDFSPEASVCAAFSTCVTNWSVNASAEFAPLTRSLIETLRVLADRFPETPELELRWAISVSRFVAGDTAFTVDELLLFSRQIRSRVDGRSDLTDLPLRWAECIIFSLKHLPANNGPETFQPVLHLEEFIIQSFQSQAGQGDGLSLVESLCRDYSEQQPSLIGRILTHVSDIVVLPEKDVALIEVLARSIQYYIFNAMPPLESVEYRRYLAKLNAIRKQFPEERTLNMIWAECLVRHTPVFSLIEPDECVHSIRELQALAATFPDDFELARFWAQGVTNFVVNGFLFDRCADAAFLSQVDRLFQPPVAIPGFLRQWSSDIDASLEQVDENNDDPKVADGLNYLLMQVAKAAVTCDGHDGRIIRILRGIVVFLNEMRMYLHRFRMVGK